MAEPKVSVAPRSRAETEEAQADKAPVTTVPGELGEFASAAEKFERVEDPEEKDEETLPLRAFKSEGFLAANGAARDNFENVVLFPGHVFISPGRYRNIYDLDDIYDVNPNTKSPEGLFLIPENYLVRGVQYDRARQEAKGR
jgi:hypothetical protein